VNGINYGSGTRQSLTSRSLSVVGGAAGYSLSRWLISSSFFLRPTLTYSAPRNHLATIESVWHDLTVTNPVLTGYLLIFSCSIFALWTPQIRMPFQAGTRLPHHQSPVRRATKGLSWVIGWGTLPPPLHPLICGYAGFFHTTLLSAVDIRLSKGYAVRILMQ